jgi:hypothetical protein
MMIGLPHPNLSIDWAISFICSGVCVRGFLGCSFKSLVAIQPVSSLLLLVIHIPSFFFFVFR